MRAIKMVSFTFRVLNQADNKIVSGMSYDYMGEVSKTQIGSFVRRKKREAAGARGGRSTRVRCAIM